MVRAHPERLHHHDVVCRIYPGCWTPENQFHVYTRIMPGIARWTCACVAIQADIVDDSFVVPFLGYCLRYDKCLAFFLSLYDMLFALACNPISGKRCSKPGWFLGSSSDS